MFDRLEALVALAENGTMRRAALALHVTQSAVSKRIQTLEFELKNKLIEPRGRRVMLTPFALQYLSKIRPLLSEIKEVGKEEIAEHTGEIAIDVSVSILISGGAEALAAVRRKMKGLKLTVGAHHASVAVERVRSGESMLALVQGQGTGAPELEAHGVYEQEIVIVPSGLKPFALQKKEPLEVLMIEAHTEAYRFIKAGLESSRGIPRITPAVSLQSFSAIVQMARAGFGHGLAPFGVARALGVPVSKLIRLPHPGLKIPVSLIGRRSTLSRPLVREFEKVLEGAARAAPG
jgi:DNA-binding transcriptional LysR family regulator